MFTTATIVASLILFGGFNTSDAVNTLSLLCGFLVIFTGVYLLNLSREDPDGDKMLSHKYEDAVPTDGLAGLQTRRSMQLRRSNDGRRYSNGSVRFSQGDREHLIHNYDQADGGQFRLDELPEESDGDNGRRRKSSDANYTNGGPKSADLEARKSPKVADRAYIGR